MSPKKELLWGLWVGLFRAALLLGFGVVGLGTSGETWVGV